MSTVTINAKIDSDTKTEAQGILSSLGLNMSEAITLFFRQIVFTKSIPFELKIPNEVTIKTHELAKNGKEIEKFDTPKELFEDIGI